MLFDITDRLISYALKESNANSTPAYGSKKVNFCLIYIYMSIQMYIVGKNV